MQITLDRLEFEELDGQLSPIPDPERPLGSLIGGDITIYFGEHRFFYPDVSAIDCAAHFAMALAGYLVSPGKVFSFFGPDYSDHYVMKWSDEEAARLAVYRNEELVCEDIPLIVVLNAMRDFNSLVRALVDERYGPIEPVKHLFDIGYF